jgi:hypothetical protein
MVTVPLLNSPDRMKATPNGSCDNERAHSRVLEKDNTTNLRDRVRQTIHIVHNFHFSLDNIIQ